MFWWHVLNNAVFGGKLLPPRKLVIRGFRDCHGWCTGYKRSGHVQMGIRSFFENREQFLIVLAHEMVHQWEHQMLGTMTHGKTFFEWEGRLKRQVGLPLSKLV